MPRRSLNIAEIALACYIPLFLLSLFSSDYQVEINGYLNRVIFLFFFWLFIFLLHSFFFLSCIFAGFLSPHSLLILVFWCFYFKFKIGVFTAASCTNYNCIQVNKLLKLCTWCIKCAKKAAQKCKHRIIIMMVFALQHQDTYFTSLLFWWKFSFSSTRRRRSHCYNRGHHMFCVISS